MICKCGHDEAFHKIDETGKCIHGLIITSDGHMEVEDMCECDEFCVEGEQ